MAESSLPGGAEHVSPTGLQPAAVPVPCYSTQYLSFVHLMAGTGSPTELQGSLTSFIQGVVTVPPKEMILAGAGEQGGGQPHCWHPLLSPERCQSGHAEMH